MITEKNVEHSRIYDEKYNFISNFLQPLIKSIDKNVDGVYYSANKYLTEIVTVKFKDNANVLLINITGDSNVMIAHDVINKFAEYSI